MNPTEFKDISDEEYREYVFGPDKVIRVVGDKLHVSASGGHRIVGRDGLAYYVPAGWLLLRWKSCMPFPFSF